MVFQIALRGRGESPNSAWKIFLVGGGECHKE